MAEEAEERSAAKSDTGPDASALNLALDSRTDEARAFLKEQRIVAGKQAELLDLQIADMKREDSVRHWSLRVRHISDVMKVTFEIAAAFIGIAIVAGICGAVWAASHDNSLVIESFSVPPDMASRGLTGQAVAAQIQDKLAAMQDTTDSARAANSYSSNWGNDIKVQIPDTGVSIGEFYRVLTLWLGHQTSISGEVFRTDKGIAVTARAGADGGTTVTGSESNFDSLLQQAAEAVFGRTQPYRYGIYLLLHNRLDLAQSVFEHLAANSQGSEKAWAEIGLQNIMDYRGDYRAADGWCRKAVTLEPDLALAWWDLGGNANVLGHDQDNVWANRKVLTFIDTPNAELNPRSTQQIKHTAGRALSFEFGDFGQAVADARIAQELPDYNDQVAGARGDEIGGLGLLHDGHALRMRFAALPHTTNDGYAGGWKAVFAQGEVTLKDWKSAIRDLESSEVLAKRAGPSAYASIPVGVWPLEAFAEFEIGDHARAYALIAKTPLDCYTCVDMRANIDAAARNWGEASYWFADAVRQAPSVPLAWSDWGAMLMAKGDLDGAIAKFELANQKGPHFADPIERWGEALIAKNRSDLALVKFEEADKYAPNWGRLHVEWGEALLYSGRRDDAKAQLAFASHLELNAGDRDALNRLAGQLSRN